ncbi:multiple sugar transport system permease protein [Pseudarthrobacter siccitolerans]|uniref:Multiple sugar transport system permease protein n=1 Tax=Pseudarthrobacter siccitolerans TaxID=861266 RepID=A0ABU0PMI0_9MICC|nr:sugar ABC transporter permease [Pseudarthrobacter siccitolerans]MDQ0675161.1 multiple sugar transport system permease protein [Pseudarthrobacter siccitolerans]
MNRVKMSDRSSVTGQSIGPQQGRGPAAKPLDRARPGMRTRGRWLHGQRAEAMWALIFLAPALIAIFAMRVAPGVGAFVSSLYKGLPGGVQKPRFSGLDNYQDLFTNPAFIDTFVRTMVFNVIINPLQLGLALLIAVVMTQRIAFRGLWRTLIFIPATIPIVGSSIAWGVALRPEGPINAIISALGGNPQPFFTSPDQALASIILVASWIGIGYWMIFLIAGLEAVPGQYYEAARIDRAGPIRTFFSITLPLLKRPLLFVLVANTAANFVLFVPVQLLTSGGPQSSTTLLMFDAYRTSYGYGSRNLGAAEIIVLTLIMLFFVALQFRLLREEASSRSSK